MTSVQSKFDFFAVAFNRPERIAVINTNIRLATQEDSSEIKRVLLDAFGDEEGPIVSQIAIDLINDEPTRPSIALVAEVSDHIVGCVIFSHVELVEHDQVLASILAPLAVTKEHQRIGIGSELVKHGLEMLKELGIDMALVYGDPKYYARFGYTSEHRVVAPYPLSHPDAWMACELNNGAIAATGGKAICAQTLSRPEYW